MEEDYKSLRVSVGNSSIKAVLSGTLTIPCRITYHSLSDEVTVGRRAVLATPRVKWTFITNGKEQEILIARGHKVKISEGYRLRASLPHYTTSAYDVTLVLKELISNDSGIYKCHVQHGIEDDYGMVEVKVKGVVFLYREGVTRYAYTFPMAQEACARIKAHIATADQLLAAYRSGYEQCDAGWIADQTVRYPIQTPREGCYGDMDGFPGVRNYGILDPDDMYDVYCYVDELNGEVFLGSEPDKFTLREARDYCTRSGAVLASTGQLYGAWDQGVDHCNPGWLSDGSVRFPIVSPREKCGGNSSGVKTVFRFRNQTGFPDPETRYDAYCFRGKYHDKPVPTQDPDESPSPSPLAEQVQDVIEVTESFKELKLQEIKAENEAQGSLDTIPLNETKATTPSTEDLEKIPTVKDLKMPLAEPTAPLGETGESGEDLSPAFASFPPYEDHSDDSAESTDSITTAMLGQSQGDTPGFVTETMNGTLEETILQATGDSILDVSFVNVHAENDYDDNITDSAQQPGVTVPESASPIPNARTLDPIQAPKTNHISEVHTQEGSSQGETSAIIDTSFSSIVPTTASSFIDADVDFSGVDKAVTEMFGHSEPHNSSLSNAFTEMFTQTSRPTIQDEFEASGNEDRVRSGTLASTPEELVSGDQVSGRPGPTASSLIFESNMVPTTPLAYSSGPQSFSSPKLTWEEGSGEVPDSTWIISGGGSIADFNNTQEGNASQHLEGKNHIANTTTFPAENSYKGNKTTPASLLISPNMSSTPSHNTYVVQENSPFPTSLLKPIASHLDLTSSTLPPNIHKNSTGHFLEKNFPPTMSFLNPTDPLPAVPTEKAIVGSSVNYSDHCYPNPCENGGTCIEENDEDFSCLCLPGYFGRVCDINVEKCPDQWDSFQGFCYRHFYTRKSWQEAETDCRDFGGHLVSVATPEEQDFLKNQYKDFQWTGLNDRTIEGDFQWSDGNAVLFENWKVGQPDSYFLSGEDCVVMGGHEDGLWNDVPCNYHLPYTCKMGLVTCGSPPEASHASTYGRPKTRYQIGSVLGYRCDDGFVQHSSVVIRCRQDGVWEEPKISCLPVPTTPISTSALQSTTATSTSVYLFLVYMTTNISPTVYMFTAYFLPH
ncbi:brevican core protein [Gastrophryne carolinensis]